MRGRASFGRLIALCFLFVAPAGADDLRGPTGDVLLEVSGDIHVVNTDSGAAFDLDMLKTLPQVTFSTSTVWTKGLTEFTGVRLLDLLQSVKAEGNMLRAVAANDYAVDVPVGDAVADGPIIAFMMDGKEMSRRGKGPLWLVYPYDLKEEYQSELIYSRSIWQLVSIEVLE